MKQINRLTYGLLSLILLTFACQQREKENILLSAVDSLMSTRPDSALHLLESTCLSHMQTDADKAQYALLLTQAQDKNYIVPTSDSLIRIATHYYDLTKNIPMQAKAHYYKARVYQELKDYPSTVREYLIAHPLIEQSRDRRLMRMLQGNLGYVYFQQNLLDKADSLYACEEELMKQDVDSVHLATLLIQRAGICLAKGVTFHTKAEKFQLRALSIANELNNTQLKLKVFGALRCLYNNMGKPTKAISYIEQELALQEDTTQRYAIYLSLSDAYSRIGQNDSAIVYAYKSLPSTNLYTKAGAYIILEDVARQKGNFAEALHFKDNYETYMDSAKLAECPIEVLTTEKDILYQQNNQKYTSSLSRYSYYLYIGIGILATLTIFFIYKRSRYHQRMLRLKKEKDSLKQTISAQSIKMKEEIESKICEIEQLQLQCSYHEGDKLKLEQLNICLNELLDKKRELCLDMGKSITKKEHEISQLIQQIQSANEIKDNIHLSELVENIRKERNFLFNALLSAQSSAYKNLLTLKQQNFDNPDYSQKPAEDIWNNLLSEVNLLTHGFIIRLTQKYERLLKEDIYFCCLVKIGMKYADIASVFGCTPNAIYKRRDTILRKMEADTKSKLAILIESV